MDQILSGVLIVGCIVLCLLVGAILIELVDTAAYLLERFTRYLKRKRKGGY
jgi:hypothetical protein